jgi:hypothetical protein
MRDEDPLKSLLRQGPPPADEEDSGLPPLPAKDYKPHSSPANKPVFTIHFMKPSGEIRSFQYVDLDSDSRYEPGVIRVRFTGTTVLEVIIHGRNLWRLYDGIHRQVIRWVMEATRDFAKDGDSIVSRIDIREVKRERSEQPAEAEESA